MLKDKTLFIPFIAFILLHIGQWMYTMNMPLFVTDYLKEQEGYVGTLASLCAGLEVPFMVILGMLSAKLATRTLLIIGAISGGAFYFSIGVFENIYAMMIGQIFLALFLAILLGLGISYFQDILPDFQVRLCFNIICECNGDWTVVRKFIRWCNESLGWIGECFLRFSNIYFHRNDIDILYERSKIYGSGCES